MPQSNGLKPKQLTFCLNYLSNGRNGTNAYLRAYPHVSKNTAKSKASRLLATDGNVQAYLRAETAKLAEKCELTAARVLAEIAKLAFAEIDLLPPRQRRDGLYAKVRALELAARSLGLLQDRMALDFRSTVTYEISGKPSKPPGAGAALEEPRAAALEVPPVYTVVRQVQPCHRANP